MTNSKNLRDNPTWKETSEIVDAVYGQLDKLIKDFPEEKWASASKLRNAANDCLYYISQAVGNALIETSSYDWSNARKHLFSLQSMYIFATKQKFLTIEPELIVRIDKLIQQIDTSIAAANAAKASSTLQNDHE